MPSHHCRTVVRALAAVGRRAWLPALAWAVVLPIAHAQTAATCGALAKVRLAAGVTVRSAALVNAGALTLPGRGRAAAETLPLPAFCRVQGTAAPNIGFEVWMPARNWNRRLLALGNGGFGGSIDLHAMAPFLASGYAVTANDTGHTGNDTAWMHDPQALLAWGHDATHQVAGPAKALVRAFYGHGQTDAYFQGCSTGGAQAMEEAEYYPADFNGIVAESPGMDYSGLMLSFLWGLKTAHDTTVLSTAKLRLLHGAVLKQCDARDGLRDGLIGAPLACRFNPETLACTGGNEENCLTPAEVKAAELIYQGPRNPRTGAQIYPGFAPGSEASSEATGRFMRNGWGQIQGGLARQYALPLLKNMVFGQNWDWTTFDWDHDVARVNAALGAKIDAMDADLRPLQRAGGKLIMVQGWDDPLNAAGLPIAYRTQVIANFTQAMPAATATRTVDGFFRLFMAPGMSHCDSGDGPGTVDALGAVQTWVEQGRAPAQLIATKEPSANEQRPARPAAATVVTTRRPLCPYPSYARYQGGDPNAPQSFACALPPAQ